MADPARFHQGRHAGVLVPLFSIPSERSWGIGEIPDLAPLARWVTESGMDIIQLLPLNEMAEGQNSPYSALSAMAIDPLYIAIEDVEEYRQAGGAASLSIEEREQLEAARRAPSVAYDVLRPLKRAVLERAFIAFESGAGTDAAARADAFTAFRAREAWWLEDYTLFRALHEEQDARYWLEWEAPLRDRDAEALDQARERLARRRLYFAWLQWLAGEQWTRVRAACGAVGLFGDFPFMVGGDSADVWARQHEFRVDVSVGVPPDAFSETGQDWGLPAYRWDVMEPDGYQWLRERTRRCSELFDGFRIDHLVGFYRTFVKEEDGTTRFLPPDEPSQRAQGERLLDVFQSHGARILVEDLGTVPEFVRESLARHDVPGMKVLRWEREWEEPGKPFRDPASYPVHSVAISGTHDTETTAEWWDAAEREEREALLRLPALAPDAIDPDAPFDDRLRDRILELLFGARSELLLLAIQDVFGWRDRINTPASVSDDNWSWRLPWPVEALTTDPAPRQRADYLASLSRRRV